MPTIALLFVVNNYQAELEVLSFLSKLISTLGPKQEMGNATFLVIFPVYRPLLPEGTVGLAGFQMELCMTTALESQCFGTGWGVISFK